MQERREMSLKETMHRLNHLLTTITKDLGKVQRGNRTAAQRVRVGTVRLEKIGKIFRKESIAAEKGGRLRKKPVVPLKRRRGAASNVSRIV